MFSLVRNRNYILILSGRVISLLGDIIQDICIMWYVLSITNSPFYASLSLIISFLPGILFSLAAGIVADKFDKRKIMIICDVINGILAFILAGVVLYYNNLYLIFLISFIMSTCDTFFRTANTCIIPEIVDDAPLMKANSLSETATNIIRIVGPTLGGYLASILSPFYLFMVNGFSFFISAIIEYFIKYNKQYGDGDNTKNKATSDEKRGNILNILTKYFSSFEYIIKYKFIFILAIIGGGIINFFIAPLSLYIPVYTKEVGESSFFYGISSSAITIGGLISSVILLGFTHKLNKKIFAVIGFVLSGISFIIFGFSNGFEWVFFALLIFGISSTITNISITTIIQEEIPGEILGKCISALILIANISVPLGYFIGGYALELFYINDILVFSGTCILLAAFISILAFRSTKMNKMTEKKLN